MWDTLRLTAIGKLIGSKVAVLLVAAFMSVFLVATAYNPTAFAVDATWSGDSISYNNDTYTKQSLTLPGTDSTSQVYVSNADKSKVIIVPGGADTTKEIANAQQATYTVDTNGNYSNQTGAQTISVEAKGAASASGTGSTQNKTSCAVDGIGWIVCSISKFLAGAMDKAYSWIAEFLTIKPLTTDTTSGLFQTWNIARGLANACFIIAFLLIIYAQITNYGISNYEIKKMIPRLIIAAITVNISYYVCAAAVDVSNILGDSIAKAFAEIRNSLPDPTPQMTWNNMTTYILSAGTIGAAVVGVSASGGILALVPLLVPILIGGILSILVALMVLAARQALVIMLVVLAPLAFVAYLLPNTEKMFEKWRSIFMNMLIIFPLFSLLFGGAQLASSIIIQSTDQISVVILAMFVQVAPLMITPFLMKVSHSLLTQVGGFIDNPRKGVVDRSRTWANERSDLARARQNAKGASKPGYTPSGLSYRLARGKHHRQNSLKLYQDQMAAAVANEKRAQDNLADSKMAALHKSAGDAVGERMFEERKSANTAEGRVMQRDSGVLRLAQSQTKTLQTMDDARWDEAVTGKAADLEGHRYQTFSHDAHISHREHHVAESNAAIAQALQKSGFATELSTDAELQVRAGGIGGEQGAIKVKATALSDVIKAGIENVNAIKTASDIDPGDVNKMAEQFKVAIAKGDIASLRAHTDMLGSAKDYGINTLRQLITDNESKIRENKDMLDTFRHHVNSNAEINQAAEDIGSWSRDAGNEWRTLQQVTTSASTWKNMTSQSFAGMKASSQEAALKARDTDGKWAISQKIAHDIVNSPVAYSGLKEVMKPLMKARANGDQLTLDSDGKLKAPLKYYEDDATTIYRRAGKQGT